MTTVFTCPRCEAKSWHPKDFEMGYCGRCHEFTACVEPIYWTAAEWNRVTSDTPDGLRNLEYAMAAVYRWRHELPG